MLHRQGTASTGSTTTTTPVVTVDRVTDAHLAQLPTLPRSGYVVAVYRDGTLDLIPQFAAEDAALISWLHTGAQKAAAHHGWAHHYGCPWCGVNNCAERTGHERLVRMSETSWRVTA
jgi:hypothetical protein